MNHREEIESWRSKIDDLDRRMVELLNDRARCALAIGRIKRSLGLPVYDPIREELVVRQAVGANSGPITDPAIGRLFERILDESRRLERQSSTE